MVAHLDTQLQTASLSSASLCGGVGRQFLARTNRLEGKSVGGKTVGEPIGAFLWYLGYFPAIFWRLPDAFCGAQWQCACQERTPGLRGGGGGGACGRTAAHAA